MDAAAVKRPKISLTLVFAKNKKSAKFYLLLRIDFQHIINFDQKKYIFL